MQYRLSTLLLAFVVVSASLAVFGMRGLVVVAFLLVIAAFYRSPEFRKRAPLLLLATLGVLCLVGLLLSVIVIVPGVGMRGCQYELKVIGEALRTYEWANGHLPPAVVADTQGNAMHSWRTLILPFMDERPLYAAYNFNEPWNGPNNSKLAAEPLPYFRCPSDRSMGDRPMTSYLAVTGPGTVWDGQHATPTPPRVMVIEVANSNIHWMEPRNLTLEEACRGVRDGSRMCISGRHTASGGFFFQDEVAGANALLSDGSVCFLPVGLPPETLRGLFTGDEKAMQACTAYQRRIHWTNCAALAVLILSYAVLVLRPRDKLPPPGEPAVPGPPAVAGGN